MSNIIKFPKEVLFLKRKIAQVQVFYEFANYKKEIKTYLEYFNKKEINKLLEVYLYKKDFKFIIEIGDLLLKKNIYSLDFDFYILLSYIASNQHFLGYKYLLASKALNPYKTLYLRGEAIYSRLFRLKDKYLYDNLLTFIIANLLDEVIGLNISDERQPYFLKMYIDALVIMSEFGYEKKFIDKLVEIGSLIFEIKL